MILIKLYKYSSIISTLYDMKQMIATLKELQLILKNRKKKWDKKDEFVNVSNTDNFAFFFSFELGIFSPAK